MTQKHDVYSVLAAVSRGDFSNINSDSLADLSLKALNRTGHQLRRTRMDASKRAELLAIIEQEAERREIDKAHAAEMGRNK
jgi:hypothetical protein